MRPAVVSRGSNQAGARVTYSAQRISPSGFVGVAGFGCAAAFETRPVTSTVASTSRIMVDRLRSDLSGRDVTPDHAASMRARLTPLVDHPLCLGGDHIW